MFVVYGKAGGFAGEFDLATLATGDGSQGFVVQGALNFGHVGAFPYPGYAGDVNAMGIDDVVIWGRRRGG